MRDAGSAGAPAPIGQGEDDWVRKRLAQRIARASEQADEAVAASAPDSPSAASPSPDDKRVAERRSEQRRTGISAKARVAFRGRELEVPLLNLSRRGCKIGAEIGAVAGDRIAIQFPECNPLHAAVRWSEGGQTGIEFAAQTALLIPSHWRLASGRRDGELSTGDPQDSRAPRHKLMWECELHWSRGVERARLRNVSAEGAMIDAARNIPVGTEVVLALRMAGTVTGTVRWSRSGQIGLQFERPFDIRKLMAPAGIKAGAAGASRPGGMLKPLYLESELDPSSPWAARKKKLDPSDFS